MSIDSPPKMPESEVVLVDNPAALPESEAHSSSSAPEFAAVVVDSCSKPAASVTVPVDSSPKLPETDVVLVFSEQPDEGRDADPPQSKGAAQSFDPDVPERITVSLGKAQSSIKVPALDAPFWKRLAAFFGVGFMVSVGYMDPGNWATDITGGSKFGYTLLFVVLLSNCTAMFLQHLSLKLGVASEKDLAQACRAAYPLWWTNILWVLAELSIAATDLAEVIGCAIAFHLLFGIPFWAGVIITLADVMLLLLLQDKNFQVLEVLVVTLVMLIAACFAYEIGKVQPNWIDVAKGLYPNPQIVANKEMLYVGIAILGATVMPHNLYLHSAIIQTRAYPRTREGKAMAIRIGTIDSTISLFFAFLINASILILAAAAFHYGTGEVVEDISRAYELLSPMLGAKAASILFGVALLASGQSATITGTLAGQIVMEGFLNMRMAPWMRRLLTRSVVAVPAAVVAAVMGGNGLTKLLVLSQVVLSMQLAFAVGPMVHITSSKRFMGEFVNKMFVMVLGTFLTLAIAGLNMYLFVQLCSSGID